jgi:uncharacterized membrane protein YcaP (DUF421 family)
VSIVVRTTVIFFFVWLCLRALGKRELAELTAFELVLVMVIGDIVQQGITQQDVSLVGAMLGVGTITLWILVSSYLSFRFRRLRPLVEGLPAVVVQDGRPNLEVLRTERLTVDEVFSAAREQGITALGDVRIAILEPEGRFTFIRRSGDPEDTQASPERKEP